MKTSALAAPAPPASVIVILLTLRFTFVDAVIPVEIATPSSAPSHATVCPLTQTDGLVVNRIQPLLPITVVVVALSTIFDGVRPTVVTSTSPSIAFIAVTELYVADALCAGSALEIAVAVNTVIVEGFAASSLAVLHVSTIAACGAVAAAPEKVIVIVSAAIAPTVVVLAWVSEIELLPLCASAQPDNVAGIAAHIDATVLVTVIVAGAVVVAEFGVHATITFNGVVPAEPEVETCVAVIASVP